MGQQGLRSGEVAARAGVNVETLRYYERRGILKDPRGGHGRFRLYPASVVDVVRFVKGAQELGFTLEEIEELLVLRNDTSRSCREVREAAEAKLEDIASKLRRLRRMKRALQQLVGRCSSDASTRECPILDAINEGPSR